MKTKTMNQRHAKKIETSKIVTLLLFIIIFLSGAYLRSQQYGIEGGVSYDTFMVIGGSVLWYYPHNFFPGKVQMYPPLAHQIIGAACMLSGADFSDAEQLQPNYIINIPALLGKAFVAAENYCLLPSYVASILLFIGLIALGTSLLSKKAALYHAAFYAFFPIIIWWGRTIYIDIFLWLFTVYGLLFLWLSYKAKKSTKKEIVYASIALALFGLAFATKLTAIVYLPFALFIFLEKYKIHRNLKKGNAKIPLPLIKILTASVTVFLIATLIPYQLNPINLIDIYNMHTYWHGNETGLKLSTNGLELLYDIMFRINIIDLIIYLLSFYITARIIRKKEKKQNEKFILYLYILGILTVTTSTALGPTLERRNMLFFFGVPLMMSLAFSGESYSVFNYLEKTKIPKKAINNGFFMLILIYIIAAFSTLQALSPFYLIYSNPVMCAIENGKHCTHYYTPYWKTTAIELSKILKDNETFYDADHYNNLYMYTKHEDGTTIYFIKESFKQQIGREITIKELKYYFGTVTNNGRNMRYLVLHSYDGKSGDILELIKNYPPDYTVYIKNHPVSYIYDLDKIYPDMKPN